MEWFKENICWIMPFLIAWAIDKRLEKINENIADISIRLEKVFPTHMPEED